MPEARLVESEQDVLGDGLRRDQREVLVDHPEPGRDRVARRAEFDGRPVEEDLAGVRPVEPRQDVHQRALAGPVLAQQGVDLARAQVEINLVVGDDAGERLDDAARLERRARARVTSPEAAPRERGWGPRATPAGPWIGLAAQGGERDRDPVGPPVHAGLALVAGGARRELVEVGLLELGAGGQDLLAGVVLDRSGEDVEPAERAGQDLGQGVLDLR